MLHSESRKNRTKDYIALSLFTCALLFTITACKNDIFMSQEDMAARLRLQRLADSAQDAQQRLGLFISNYKDSLEADRLVSRYYQEGNEWVWLNDENEDFIEKAETTVHFLENEVQKIGFTPKAFFTTEILKDLEHFRTLDFDSTNTSVTKTMAELELNLSKAYIRYALGQRYGFMNPHKVFNRLDKRKEGGYRIVYDVDIEQPSEDFTKLALAHAADENPSLFLAGLESHHPVYNQLKERLTTDSTPDGRQRILCNMERLRWRHTQKTDSMQKHVFVNIPSQQLWAIRPDSVFSMRICCGAWKTKTPLLSSKIRLIQLNPEWNIPGSILRDEVSQHAGDSAYFARNDYFIVHRNTGDTISPKDITRTQLRSGAYRVAQHSGPRNSLGRIIFRFNNQFDVYLHDTNNKNAFNYDRRTISHGCVRIQRPFDMIKFLMSDAQEWTLDKIRMNIDMRPEGDKGKRYQREHTDEEDPLKGIKMSYVSVKPHIPVVIDYYTLYPNPETGKWETWPDRYEYDKQIARRIKPFMP